MAGQTTNYSFDYPTSTDYVKDGATAIQTLATDVDTTLFTALGGAYPGMRLIKKQTIGSGVSSVTVTGAFSATYDNYKIIVSGGASNAANRQLGINLGSATTGYYYVLNFSSYVSGTGQQRGNNAGGWGYVGTAQPDALALNCDILNPFANKLSYFGSFYSDTANTGMNNGYLNTTASYTSFILSSDGTMTGGTIYVYGYGAS